jgi:hypothetical protein
MMSFLKSSQAAHWASAVLVIIASAIVGRQAATGMSSEQWACAVFAVLGSVSVAVMVRVWPAPAKAAANERR